MCPLSRSLPVAALMVALLGGCTATPQPDIPTRTVDPIVTTRLRIDIDGPDRLLVTGLDGAADPSVSMVRVEALATGETVEVPIAGDGSFVAEVNARADQVLGVSQLLGELQSEVVFVAGNAERDAVAVGTEEECFLVEEPTLELCLVCRTPAGDEVLGCALDDFSDESVLNPANVAECLFLSTDFVELEAFPDIEDVRWAMVNVFNGCGEPVLVEVVDVDTTSPERFELFPGLGEPVLIDPTFFGTIDIFYDGTGRLPEEPSDEAFVIIDVLLPPLDDFPEEFLGSLGLSIFAP